MAEYRPNPRAWVREQVELYEKSGGTDGTTLRETGHADFKIIELPGLNHLFQHSETGAIGEYGKIDETFAPEALEVVATWIRQHTGLGRDSK